MRVSSKMYARFWSSLDCGKLAAAHWNPLGAPALGDKKNPALANIFSLILNIFLDL